MSGSKRESQLMLPPSGTLWYGCQSSLDDYLSASIKLAAMDPLELSEMSVKAQEMRGIMATSEDNYAGHYMVDSYGDGRIAVVSIQGALMHHPLPLRMFGMNVTTYNEIRDAVALAMSDNRVERVLLAVGSGGGNGGGLFATSNFLEKAGKIKPVDTFTDSMMGSAAYWLGVNGKAIYAEPLSDVGSIGVYVTLTSRARMLADNGIDVKVVRAGEFKALGHPDEPLSEKAVETIQASVDKSYDAFLEHTSSKRGQQKEAFRVKAAEGRVFSGTEAAEVGLVDHVMLFDEVLDKLLSAKRKTVPQGGRNQKMHEGTMDKLLKLMQEMGISLSADQQAALASGASLDSIGLAADVVAKLEAALDEGNEAEGGEGGAEGADNTQVEANQVEKTAGEPNKGAGGMDLSAMIDKIAALSTELATVKGQLQAAETARDNLQALADSATAQLTMLKPIVAASVNRMEMGLRTGVTSGLEALSPEALAEKYEATKTKFESTFPVGQRSKTAAVEAVGGEARKLPSDLVQAATAATSI